MSIATEQVYEWLSQVSDPEVPVLTVIDMGIIRDVRLDNEEGTEVTIVITPTYSGCPAMDMISMNIRMSLMSRGIKKVHFQEQLSPAWTTDWMSEDGKRKLKEYGIAPPQRKTSDSGLGLFQQDNVPCPRCGSTDTELVSQYGPTSCKALYKCNACKEPFEHFKCH
ncbi:MAG: phenylacetate-CoA oxygenase subunit PaaJ [Chitinophagaceae bacterium]|nr:phenylacetate-CoA oxygenase subunit PaaJ [Chitinophagaceae bacterium]MCB9044735.1 phenylacetate-CoA oxygenase subunit PaaJ [Chitinophagales bacterium]